MVRAAEQARERAEQAEEAADEAEERADEAEELGDSAHELFADPVPRGRPGSHGCPAAGTAWLAGHRAPLPGGRSELQPERHEAEPAPLRGLLLALGQPPPSLCAIGVSGSAARACLRPARD